MSENLGSDLLLETLKAIRAELATMNHRLGDLTSIMLEEQKHTRALMQTTGRHEESFAHLQLRPDRNERRLDLVNQP